MNRSLLCALCELCGKSAFKSLRAHCELCGKLLLLFLISSVWLRAGWSFDTGLTPEATAELLAGADAEQASDNSWLRLRGMERSAVRDAAGNAVSPRPGGTPVGSLAERRSALTALREHGYRLVAFIRWSSDSWAGGVRSDNPLRRLPVDLREVAARTRALVATYGDLIDYWEIENEPDISFVEENPETYVAFLHAAGIGIEQGRRENPLLEDSGAVRGNSAELRSRVLMAPLALPPGPWFEAFLANEGMRFTDAFNYHYYGYAEDFTGVYQQFEEAVRDSPDTSVEGVTRFATQFYPNSANWSGWVLDTFDHPADWAAENRALLLNRPRATEEPELKTDGRWLVSDGVTVTEDGDTWRFQIDRPAPGPRRPAMAELPLPDGWVQDMDSLLGFEYRLGEEDLRPEQLLETRLSALSLSNGSGRVEYPTAVPALSLSNGLGPRRDLPILLTEYGYGLLDATDPDLSASREAQKVWFEQVETQVRQLGIEGAMAFQLRPFRIDGINEFGLLTSVDGSLAENSTPALESLLAGGRAEIPVRRWNVPEPAPTTAVVIDFVAGPGLERAKSYGGFLVRGSGHTPASGQLVLYNFGTESVTGTLTLEGSPWSLTNGNRSVSVTLAAGARREIPVVIDPQASRFEALSAHASFVLSDQTSEVYQPNGSNPTSPTPTASAEPVPTIPVRAAAEDEAPFDALIRTRNGNLYQTWPRPVASTEWQTYGERLGNFTMTFFGRAHLPWRLEENEPAALVFFFRPEEYPATFEIRRPQILEISAE